MSTKTDNFKTEIVWKNVYIMSLYHILAFYGIYLISTGQTRLITFIWAVFISQLGSLGIISGAHRLWTHRSYKAKLPLRIFLMICNTIGYQNSIYVWARDHRVHHKFTDTDADPHNINRGFFFAHMGWLLCRKHPDVMIKGKTVDMSDLEEDGVVMFQKKYFVILATTISFILPALIPLIFFDETIYSSICVATMLRYVGSLHITWLVNSVAHYWGSKPYDKSIKAVENPIVSALTQGEGFHNYHHTFPWDYKAAELDIYYASLNTSFINIMAKLGLAYDLKTVPNSMVERRKLKNKSQSTNISSSTNPKKTNTRENLVYVDTNGSTILL